MYLNTFFSFAMLLSSLYLFLKILEKCGFDASWEEASFKGGWIVLKGASPNIGIPLDLTTNQRRFQVGFDYLFSYQAKLGYIYII